MSNNTTTVSPILNGRILKWMGSSYTVPVGMEIASFAKVMRIQTMRFGPEHKTQWYGNEAKVMNWELDRVLALIADQQYVEAHTELCKYIHSIIRKDPNEVFAGRHENEIAIGLGYNHDFGIYKDIMDMKAPVVAAFKESKVHQDAKALANSTQINKAALLTRLIHQFTPARLVLTTLAFNDIIMAGTVTVVMSNPTVASPVTIANVLPTIT